jgi:hypothetical protein
MRLNAFRTFDSSSGVLASEANTHSGRGLPRLSQAARCCRRQPVVSGGPNTTDSRRSCRQHAHAVIPSEPVPVAGPLSTVAIIPEQRADEESERNDARIANGRCTLPASHQPRMDTCLDS